MRSSNKAPFILITKRGKRRHFSQAGKEFCLGPGAEEGRPCRVEEPGLGGCGEERREPGRGLRLRYGRSPSDSRIFTVRPPGESPSLEALTTLAPGDVA